MNNESANASANKKNEKKTGMSTGAKVGLAGAAGMAAGVGASAASNFIPADAEVEVEGILDDAQGVIHSLSHGPSEEPLTVTLDEDGVIDVEMTNDDEIVDPDTVLLEVEPEMPEELIVEDPFIMDHTTEIPDDNVEVTQPMAVEDPEPIIEDNSDVLMGYDDSVDAPEVDDFLM